MRVLAITLANTPLVKSYKMNYVNTEVISEAVVLCVPFMSLWLRRRLYSIRNTKLSISLQDAVVSRVACQLILINQQRFIIPFSLIIQPRRRQFQA